MLTVRPAFISPIRTLPKISEQKLPHSQLLRAQNSAEKPKKNTEIQLGETFNRRSKRQASEEGATQESTSTQLQNANEIITHCSERVSSYSTAVDYAINLAYQANSPNKTQRLHDFLMLMKGVGDQPVSGHSGSNCWGEVRKLLAERLNHYESRNNITNSKKLIAYTSLRNAAVSAGIADHISDILTIREQSEEENGRRRVISRKCYFNAVSCF